MQIVAHVDAVREFRSLLSSLYLSVAVVGSSGIATEAEKATLVARLVDEVVALYCEIHRDYHDIRHPISMWRVAMMLKAAGKLDLKVDEKLLLLLILLHDVIVKLGRVKGWNERMSAELATNHLQQLGAPENFIHIVCYGITCTTNHKIDHNLRDEMPTVWYTVTLLLDLDLLGLGQDVKSFALDTECVWKEFCAVATREEYDHGRILWARSFLERPRIYHTEVFHHLEAQAQKNLRELAQYAA
jgi:predicted metal-dependent HD superfamily phosphohydrolase